jgi:hypothetical protein
MDIDRLKKILAGVGMAPFIARSTPDAMASHTSFGKSGF